MEMEKKKTIINGLYSGEVCALDRRINTDPEYIRLSKKLIEDSNYILKNLSTVDTLKFEAIRAAQVELRSMDERSSFAYGFRLGVMMMAEVFSGSEVTLLDE